jgi:ATP-dependent DNA helicase RecG
VNKLQQLSISALKGIGAETNASLNSLGILSVADLIEYFPYRYEDYRLRDLAEVKHEETVTVEGIVHGPPNVMFYGKKKSRLTFRMLVGRYAVNVTAFNRGFLKNKLQLNETVTVTGKWDKNRQTISLKELKVGPFKAQQEIEPVYSVKGNLTVKALRRFIRQALSEYGEEVAELLPKSLLDKYRLLEREEALKVIHLPKTHEELKYARRRFVYEEFLLFQLKMQVLRKREREGTKGMSQHIQAKDIVEFTEQLPFPLTGAQKRVVNEIFADMKSPYRMNRLLQGDVGSGKTVVAAIALFGTVKAGYQGALMVPTEILAEQHVSSLKELLGRVGITVELLTSSVKGKRRRELLEKVESGEVDVLVGTHALIQGEVMFKKLGLVITDEQHRFGVNQRRTLREKGEFPDVLFMTATPIPRTLAITAFGEMDVSVIDEMPAGRKAIETYWVKHDMLERILQFVQKELVKGRQAYVICPLIEESEKLDVQNAIDVHATLQQYFGDKWNVGLMHGKLHPDEKDEVMREFSENKTQILVSTTVVEVGVNVPNATMMVIYDAERFGLSQLHQLRGRVGRGSEQSYCVLLADPKSEVGKERMKIMTETNDGFVLSEKDLELRGPGDFFGKKQSGLPDFKVADMVHDYRALETARDDAAKIVNSEKLWKDKEFAPLLMHLEETGALTTEKLD